MRKWTMMETLKGKTRSVVILTIILTIIVNKLLNQIMNSLINRNVAQDMSHLYTTTVHFSFGYYGVIFAIPAGIISILIVNFFMNRTKKEHDNLGDERTFKWYSIYGIICGIFILSLLKDLSMIDVFQLSFSNSLVEYLYTVTIFFAPMVIAILSTMVINRVMLRITNTNAKLIERIENGNFSMDIPDERTKGELLKLLKKGHVSTIRGGKFYLNIQNVIAAIIYGVTVFIIALFEATPKMKTTGYGGQNRMQTLHNESNKVKSNLEHEAKKKKDHANYKFNKAMDQIKYNPKYSYQAKQQANRAFKEAEEARRKADQFR